LSFGVIAAIVGAVVGAVWGGWLGSRRTKRFEALALRLWATLDRPAVFRIPEAKDTPLLAALEEIDSTTIEQSFNRLGDLVVTTDADFAMRVFARDSTTIAYFVAMGSGVVVGLESYTDTDEFVTYRSKHARDLWTKPPFAHNQYLPASTGLDVMLVEHRQLTAKVANSLVSVTTLADAKHQFDKFASLAYAWRVAQPPDDLLASDLAALLGERAFARHGEGWIRRFKRRRAKLPEARVKSSVTCR
jgi:hypothetical protein